MRQLILGIWLAVALAGSLWASSTPAPQSIPIPSPARAEETVYVTKTGAKYHKPGCRHLKSSSIPMKLEEARKKFGPCSVCKPPM